MTAKKRDTAKNSRAAGSDLKKVDAHVLGPKDYEDIPELTDAWFRSADMYVGGKLVRRGRPPLSSRKRPVSLRLDPDVLAHFRRTGRGWQSRINSVLRKAAKLPNERKKKARI
jgi:uncharacterized protein (DUF4415 family)